MPPTNLILNGTFDDGNDNWSGSDLETHHSEGAYLRNGSSNRVAELDGVRNKQTVMEQTITVDDPFSSELTFDVALRNASLRNAGSEGFDVEIVDSTGTVIADGTSLPTTNNWVSVSIPVTFSAAGDYTVRFKELGPDDSLGAIIDNIALMVCFHGDTQIAVEGGTKRAADITSGELVLTENGLKPVRWVGRRRVTEQNLQEDPRFAPVQFKTGSLGGGLPRRTLKLSRQHRIAVTSKICERMFEIDTVLVPAIGLTSLPGIKVDLVTEAFDYVHLLFDSHEIVFAEGVPSESLLLADHTRAALSPAAREELALIFPQRFEMEPAKPIPDADARKSLITRHRKNRKSLLGI